MIISSPLAKGFSSAVCNSEKYRQIGSLSCIERDNQVAVESNERFEVL
jgi:hypothetical protein